MIIPMIIQYLKKQKKKLNNLIRQKYSGEKYSKALKRLEKSLDIFMYLGLGESSDAKLIKKITTYVKEIIK